MTARSIGEIAGLAVAAKATRSFQPVRRNSYYLDDPRSSRLWRPIADTKRNARRLIAARMQAAEFYDRKHKKKHKRNGPLGHVGLEVLRELYRIVDYKTGRLDPAIATICERIRRSRAAVVAAMRRLKEHGFLNWVRRSEPTHNEGAGPQVRQITNAYGFGLPKAAAAWVERVLRKGPPPDCEVARREADRAAVDKMLETVDTDEVVDLFVDNPQLAKTLRSFGRALSKKSASSLSGQKPDSRII